MPMSLVRIRFRQSGGFAGLIRGYEMTAADTGPQDVDHLERLLKASGLTDRPAAASARTPPKTSDLVQYDIDIETDGGTKHVVLTDDDLDEKTEPLVHFLQQRSKPMKP